MQLSLVIPIYNEEDNIKLLIGQITESVGPLALDYEIIAINDGSQDGSLRILKELAAQDLKLKVANFKKNYGQTAAMAAGFDLARGEVVITMDADLQNDPADIPKLLDKMNEGYDVVSGWRKNRKDAILSRKIPSWAANSLISKITKVNLHDYGCTLKAYRKEVVKDIRLYGEMHRFIPAYASWYGARIVEMPVNHRPRIYGKTKYGIGRTLRVILDLLTVKFLTKYSTRPMHFFGGAGFFSLIFGIICFAAAIYLRLIGFATLIQTPLPLMGAFFSIVSIQLVLMGLLAEMIMRNYYEIQNKTTYTICEKINF